MSDPRHTLGNVQAPSPSRSPEPKRIPPWLRVILRILGDLVLFVAGSFVMLVGVANVPHAFEEGSARPVAAGLVLFGFVLWGTVFARRRLPALPIAAGLVLATIGAEYLLFLVGAYHAMLRWRGRWAQGAAVAAPLVVVVFAVRELTTPWADEALLAPSSDERGEFTAVLTIAFAVLALLTLFGLTALARSRRERDHERERADAEHGRAEALGEEIVRQTERERLARDIHDALAHRLSVISLQSGALEEAARSRDPAVARAAQTLRGQAHQSLEDLRGLLGELRSAPQSQAHRAQTPPALASMRQLGHLIRSVREGGAVVDALVLIEDAERAGAALDRTVYRIVQESLTNALKHAPRAPVSVYVDASAATGVRIRVMNPLPPRRSTAAPGGGRGLAGIRERAALLGGTAWIGEADGSFVVDVSLPWPTQE